MQVLMYKVSQQKYLTGGFTLSNILLIGLIAVSILLVFLAIAILIRLSRLSNKLKQMGINYDVTGFGVKQKEENPFKNMHNNYDGDTAIINNSNNRPVEHNYIRNDYNHTNHKNNNINNTVNNNLNNTLKENNHIISVYNDFDNNSENNIDLGMFTKINYNDYYNNQEVVEDIAQENKIIIRPKGSK